MRPLASLRAESSVLALSTMKAQSKEAKTMPRSIRVLEEFDSPLSVRMDHPLNNNMHIQAGFGSSDVQVDDFEGVVLDEFAALLDVFAHERGENFLGGDGILEADFQKRARLGIHRGGPEL